MKTIFKNLLLLVLTASLALTSCRKEEDELITAPTEEVLGANSSVAGLMSRVSTFDGSFDNIIDSANCFAVNLPVTVIVNGIEVVVNTPADYQLIEDILDESSDDTDTVEIIFPITVTLSDYSEVTLNSIEELIALALTCNGEGESDDDIECLDFQYPITATIFNPVTEELETIVIETDAQLYAFLEGIDSDDVVNIEFPIYVILADGSTVEINDLVQLENVIDAAEDTCDEDDDYDYDDDDCETCTTDALVDLLTGCSPWYVDDLERDDNDLEDLYNNYFFTFTASGEILVEFGTDTFNGTWSSSGTGTGISVEINIPGLADFNDTWNLHEIEDVPGEFKVDLRLGDDRLEFESDCDGTGGGGGGDDDAALVTALTTGDWYVNYYFDDVDETADYADYVFNFNEDGTAAATDGSGTTPGTWSTGTDEDSETGLDLTLNFGTSMPLDEFLDDWDVIEYSDTIIKLKDVSGGDGTTDFLTFGRDPFDGGGGTADVETTLLDGTWIVALYMDDTDNETANYTGFELDFAADGTVVATNGSDTVNGTWDVISGGTKVVLDFGTVIPFDEFNDDWDVFMVEPARVELRDVSGGDGTLDILVFEKL